MSLAWVVGAGGLLGSALTRTLSSRGANLFAPSERLTWLDPLALDRQVSQAVRQFSERVTDAVPWEIYWAAGIGNIGSEAASLAAETRALQALLDALAGDVKLHNCPGSLAFASSAGAIYAGSVDETITELSLPAPTTAYGMEKLRQESCLQDFRCREPAHKLLIARISTLFGPRQLGSSSQGLFSHLVRGMLKSDPVRVFVPLDTMRDYIYSDDAANDLVSVLRAMPADSGPLIKIVAAQHSTTIAEILSTFTRVAHKHPRIVTAATPLTAKYSACVRYRSVVGPHPAERENSALHVCIAKILEAERLAYARSAPH